MRRPLALLVILAASPAAAAEKSRPGPAALAKAIDRHIADGLAARGLKPAPRADDAAFFRRVNLALAGRIPLPAEVRAFLADADPDKRRKAVDKLLESPAHANHFTTLWRGWLLPEALATPEIAQQVPGFEAWLRPQIAANVPFDKFVFDLLTYRLDAGRPTARNVPQTAAADGTSPLAFYLAKEAKPENLAAVTSRIFLGVQLECAQCHDHPFARWSREQFWGLAAFFGGVEQVGGPGGAMREVFDRRELPIPNTEPIRIAVPTFLDEVEPEWRFKTSGRETLARWMTRKDNPFFARAAANRVWGYLFGVGIVDPVDDFNDKNEPSHPELLDDLARAFAGSGFDVRYLVRAIVLSETFQRSSIAAEPGHTDVRAFARFPVQGLSPEQLYDSLAVAIMAPPEGGPGGAYLQNPGSGRRQFLDKFNPAGKKIETETTIIQALTLMNGGLVANAASLKSGRTLAAIVELPGLTPAERVDAIYLAVLSRPAQPEELARVLRHVGDRPEKYADVLWVLLNSVEFRTNH